MPADLNDVLARVGSWSREIGGDHFIERSTVRGRVDD
jgi:hypothetical protein